MTHLIALIDGSGYSQSVCDLTRWVAERTDASVDLMHVLGRRGVGSEPTDLSGSLKLGARTALLKELADLDEQKNKLELKRGRLLLEEAKTGLEEAGLKSVGTKLRHGDLIEGIAEFEGEADLILVGKRGEAAGLAMEHLGSNLERIVRASHRPVYIANRAFKPINSVLVAFDGGPSSLKAIDYIARSPMFAGLTVTLVFAGKNTPAIQKSLSDATATLKAGGFEAKTIVESGEPEKVLAQITSTGAHELLVMGAYGHSRVRSFIIGSTTTEMIRSCKVPILIMR